MKDAAGRTPPPGRPLRRPGVTPDGAGGIPHGQSDRPPSLASRWRLISLRRQPGRSATGPAALAAASSDIRRARVLRVARVRREPGGAQVQVDVRIVPTGMTTPWGAPGTHTLFVKLTGSASGGWLVASWGTSP
jgi:hypothetical protein